MFHRPIPIHPGSSDSGDVDCNQLRQDIKHYEDLLVAYNRSLETAVDPSVRRDLLNGIALTNQFLSHAYATLATHCVHPPFPPIEFKIDPWELVSGEGIDLGGGAWNTGSVWCVYPLPNDGLLVGTEQGGLWLSRPDGGGDYQSECLSNDWEHWKVVSLAPDPAHPTRVFAGCGHDSDTPALYIGPVDPPDDWTNIPLPSKLAEKGSEMKGVLVLPRQRILVVATSHGLGWTSIDTEPYTWHTTDVGANDLALTMHPDNPGLDAFVIVTASSPRELMRASIVAGAISLTPVGASDITWTQQPSSFMPRRVASCRHSLNNLYCLASAPGGLSGTLCILRSTDSGRTWSEVGYSAATASNLANVLDFTDQGVKSDYSITVHPSNATTIAVAYGQAAVSTDGGVTWPWNTGTSGSPAAHSDVHNLHFNEAGDLFIPNDGGIAIHTVGGALDSRRNRTLPVLMLLAPETVRQMIGNLSVAGGLIAAGTMDNGNLWLKEGATEWHRIAAGDGGDNALYRDATGTYIVSCQNFNNIPAVGSHWRGAQWDAFTRVPVLLSDNVSLDNSGLIPIIRPVAASIGMRGGPNNGRVIALAATAKDNLVYGAVLSGANALEWVVIGRVPPGEVIVSVEPHDATTMLAGTTSGRLFAVRTDGSRSEIGFPDASKGNRVGAVASNGFAIACFRAGLYVMRGPQPLERLSNSTFPPNANDASTVHDIAANRNQEFSYLSFAITIDEHEVWVSNSIVAALWHRVAHGLPAGARVGSLDFSETNASGHLWLGTYGRSLWRVPFG